MINSTQQAINIAGIKDGIVVMKDGTYRLVLQISAANFALKSEEEKNSIIFQYQGFLNSLHFPIEIVVKSRRLDLTPYINNLEKTTEKQSNELIKMQTQDYVDFLKKLIEMANIMKKTFYVAISYEPINVKKLTFFDKLFGSKTAFEGIKISDQEYKEYTNKLRERASIVAQGLGGMGLHCFQLSTEDLIELFYTIYNPDDATKERIKDVTMLASPFIMSEAEFGDNKPVTPTTPAPDNSSMIDNSHLVEAQRQHQAEIKKQEEAKSNKEIDVKFAPPTATQPQPPKTQVENPSLNSSQVADPAGAQQNTATNPTNQSGQYGQ